MPRSGRRMRTAACPGSVVQQTGATGASAWPRGMCGKPTASLTSASRGPIPDGLVIDHLCLNKGCVNPDHMELVTIGENVKRHFRLMTHCKSGRHEFTEANTITHHGRRQCRACKNEWQRNKKASLV
jgi:hypothetical protein